MSQKVSSEAQLPLENHHGSIVTLGTSGQESLLGRQHVYRVLIPLRQMSRNPQDIAMATANTDPGLQVFTERLSL